MWLFSNWPCTAKPASRQPEMNATELSASPGTNRPSPSPILVQQLHYLCSLLPCVTLPFYPVFLCFRSRIFIGCNVPPPSLCCPCNYCVAVVLAHQSDCFNTVQSLLLQCVLFYTKKNTRTHLMHNSTITADNTRAHTVCTTAQLLRIKL